MNVILNGNTSWACVANKAQVQVIKFSKQWWWRLQHSGIRQHVD